jgi:hypothetical protein
MAARATTCAANPDFRSYFAHPDVHITMDFGEAIGHATAIPWENHTEPTIAAPKPVFQGGWQMSGSRPDNPRVEWRFVKKTDAGDLYIFDVHQDERLKKEFSVTYDGSSAVVYDRDQIAIAFERP